jgi:chromosome segregation ATPase
LQKLSVELNLKETQLLELAGHCEGLQGYPDIQQLAVALSEHIKPVQEALHEAEKELKMHHDVLQVLENLYQSLAKQLSSLIHLLSFLILLQYISLSLFFKLFIQSSQNFSLPN